MDMGIVINLIKAKAITHNARRAARTKEFAPLDVKATIPSEAAAAEEARAAIRIKYADMQTAVDAADDLAILKIIIKQVS